MLLICKKIIIELNCRRQPEDLRKNLYFSIIKSNNKHLLGLFKHNKPISYAINVRSASGNGKVFIDGWTASPNCAFQNYEEDVKIVL